MWQIILAGFSAILFFGFVILSVRKFGLLSCFSAYAPKWKEAYPIHNFNWWSFVTILSAALLIPVLLEQSEGNPLQFTGFLAPLSLFLVGLTPNYQTSKAQNVGHQIGAWSAVALILIYIFVVPKMLVPVIILVTVGLVLSLAKKDTVMFWLEMAIYASLYLILANTSITGTE
jgi:hypothetical protein